MSSRALRKLQREREEQRQLALSQKDNASSATNSEKEDEDEESHSANQSQQKQNAFDFLNSANAEEGDKDDDDSQIDRDPDHTGNVRDHSDDRSGAAKDSESEDRVQLNSSQKRKTKKKKKKAAKGKAPQHSDLNAKAAQGQGELDEIDLALKSLKVKGKEAGEDDRKPVMDTGLKKFYELLAIDSKHLNALNEMKKLFGNIVFEAENEGAARPAGRRRGRGQEQVDLGGALAGRNSVASRGQRLTGLVLRKNIFMPGKEDWPKGTSGGLGMEIVEQAEDFTTEYRFVHSRIYQRAQAQFVVCVEIMDPNRMIQHLQFNPYHVSTLLQVAEIAKHQGDHSVSADLLERALFTFGRSVHSTFQIALSEGKARLDFRRPENREFWLAAWRYIASLGKRGTWRTAYEWAKLLLSLDPEGDPYRIRMIIDQLAIRGGQFEHFIDLASTPTSIVDWGQESPNVQISLALAHYKLKRAEKSRSVLSTALKNYPWVFDRLIKELNIENIKNSAWGKVPRTPYEELQTATYVLYAKDIWNAPEALSLLVEVIETNRLTEPAPSPNPEDVITISEARHIFLSEIPTLLALLPRTFTTQRTSASDPLAPEDDLPSYGGLLVDGGDESEVDEQGEQAARRDPGSVRGWVNRMLSRLTFQPGPSEGNESTEDQQEDEQVDATTPGDLPQVVNEVIQAMQDRGLPIGDLIDRGAQLGWIGRNQIALELPDGALDDLPRRPLGGENEDDDIGQQRVQDLLLTSPREENEAQPNSQPPQGPVTGRQTDETTLEASSHEPTTQTYDDEAN